MSRELEELGLRQALQAGDLRPLEEKAALLLEHTVDHHLTAEGLLAYRRPFPYAGKPIASHSDTLAWTALWAASQALSFRVSGDLQAAAARDQALGGLHHLAMVSGTPGVLARTMVPFDASYLQDNEGPRRWHRGQGQHRGLDYTQYLWADDNAKFLVCAWALALHLSLPQLQDEQLKADLLGDLRVVIGRIAENDYYLLKADGSRERFGDFHPAARGAFEWFLRTCQAVPVDLWPFFDFAIGSNAMLAVALARVHDAHNTEEALYPELVDQGFLEFIESGVYRAFGVTHYDNDLFTALATLAILESDPPDDLRQCVREAMCSIWDRHRHHRNPIQTLVAWQAGAFEEEDQKLRLEEALYSLHVYPLDRRIYSVDQRDSTLVHGRWFRGDQADHAMPLNLLPCTSIYWKSNPSRIYRPQPAEGAAVHTGMDFHLAYWLYQAWIQAE
jgi:hypothetical protein